MNFLSLISLLLVAVPFTAYSAPTYVVKLGDYLNKIATEHGISLNDLINANPQIENPNKISPGQNIFLPEGEYTVKPRETQDRIASKYGYSLKALVASNPLIPNPDGEIPVRKYTVQSGDSLFKISHVQRIPYEVLLQANPQITNPGFISIGQEINVPFSNPDQIDQIPMRKYTLKRGDTLRKIAEEHRIPYQSLRDANQHIYELNAVSEGDEINIPY